MKSVMSKKMEIYAVAKPKERINIGKSVVDQRQGAFYAKRVTFSSRTP